MKLLLLQCLFLALSVGGQNVSPISSSNSGIVGSLIKTFTSDRCNNHINLFNRAGGVRACAVLFDEENCGGSFEVVGEGYNVLDDQDDDSESVLVRPGCVLVGYDRTRANIFGQGDRIVVSNVEGRSYNLNEPLLKNLDGDDDLEEDISAVECTCQPARRRPSPSRVAGPAGGAGRASTGNSANAESCKSAFASGAAADCILYDDEDCQVEDWDAPVSLTRGQQRAFTFDVLNPLRSLKFRNTVESVSVRAGCKLEVFDDSNFGNDDQGIDDQYTFVAPQRENLHVTLDESDNLIVRALDDDIDSVKCSCP